MREKHLPFESEFEADPSETVFIMVFVVIILNHYRLVSDKESILSELSIIINANLIIDLQHDCMIYKKLEII